MAYDPESEYDEALSIGRDLYEEYSRDHGSIFK
jgi:hypothetical protein